MAEQTFLKIVLQFFLQEYVLSYDLLEKLKTFTVPLLSSGHSHTYSTVECRFFCDIPSISYFSD
jgi:hypothetical protein